MAAATRSPVPPRVSFGSRIECEDHLHVDQDEDCAAGCSSISARTDSLRRRAVSPRAWRGGSPRDGSRRRTDPALLDYGVTSAGGAALVPVCRVLIGGIGAVPSLPGTERSWVPTTSGARQAARGGPAARGAQWPCARAFCGTPTGRGTSHHSVLPRT